MSKVFALLYYRLELVKEILKKQLELGHPCLTISCEILVVYVNMPRNKSLLKSHSFHSRSPKTESISGTLRSCLLQLKAGFRDTRGSNHQAFCNFETLVTDQCILCTRPLHTKRQKLFYQGYSYFENILNNQWQSKKGLDC